MIGLVAVLSLALAVQTARLRSARQEGALSHGVAVSALLVAVAAAEDAQRRRVELGALAARALELERRTIALNQRDHDRDGQVTDAGAMLTVAAYRLCQDVDAARKG